MCPWQKFASCGFLYLTFIKQQWVSLYSITGFPQLVIRYCISLVNRSANMGSILTFFPHRYSYFLACSVSFVNTQANSLLLFKLLFLGFVSDHFFPSWLLGFFFGVWWGFFGPTVAIVLLLQVLAALPLMPPSPNSSNVMQNLPTGEGRLSFLHWSSWQHNRAWSFQ